MSGEHVASLKREYPESSAVMYLRVSSKEQEVGGFSIDAQRRSLEQYAQEHSMKILRTFTDVETAKRAGRAEFGRMITFLNENPACRAILVEKTDRLYRNIKDWVTLDDLSGLTIHLVKENKVLSEDSRSSDKFIHGIQVLMAKNFIDNLSEESKKGMIEKARQGIWPSFAPVGYVNVLRPDGKKVIEPDPVLAPIVTRLFTEYAEGNRSIADIVKYARRAGITARRSARAYGKASIQRILRNPLYRGDVAWCSQVFAGIHAPLVSRQTWQTVQDTLDGKRRLDGRRCKHDFPFARLIVCGHCGGLMTGQRHGQLVYYHCSGHYGKCPEPYIRQEKLEEAFSEVLRGLQMDDAVIQWARANLLDRKARRAESGKAELERLQTEYDSTKHRFEAFYEDKLNGAVPAWLFTSKSAEYQQKMAECLNQIEGISDDSPLDVEKVVSILETAQKASERFSALPDSEKSRLLHHLVLKCTWMAGELGVTFKQPFDMIAEASAAWNAKKVAGLSDSDLFTIWYPKRDLNKG
jgi:site-specific DNA recombinase